MTGLDTIGVLSVFDEDGRFSPQFDQDDRQRIEADTVILAIGQSVDTAGLDGIEISPRGTIATDPATMAASADGVFSRPTATTSRKRCSCR